MKLATKYIQEIVKCKKNAFNFNLESSQNVWECFHPLNGITLPNQGWKIHISVSVSQCLKMFECPIPYLVKNNIAFKLPSTINKLIAINSGEYGETQIGKIITIYPANTKTLKACVKYMKTNMRIVPGPCIPSDIRLSGKSPIYFRYGSFLGKQYYILENGLKEYYLLDNNGNQVKEERTINSTQPDFAPSLPFKTMAAKEHYFQRVDSFKKYFIPVSLLYKSFKSDITIGLHKNTGAVLIQKRAYSKISENINGIDSTNYLENEYSFLKSLNEIINCPKPYSFKRLMEYSVIYEEYIEGKTLLQLERSQANVVFPLIFEQIIKLHEAGVSHNDIKPTNIIVSNNKIYLTDFEIAQYLNEKREYYGGTRGYMVQSRSKNGKSKADFYAFSVCLGGHLLNFENSDLLLSLRQIINLLDFYGYSNAVKAIKIINSAYDKINYIDAYRYLNYVNVRNLIKTGNLVTLKSWFKIAILDQLSLTKDDFIKTQNNAYWISPHTTQGDSNVNYGINTGNSGTVIGLVIISRNTGIRILDDEINECCITLSKFDKNLPYGLFNGQSGIAVALIMGGIYLKDNKYIKYGLDTLKSIPENDISPDYFNGHASILFALCKAYKLTKCEGLVTPAFLVYKKILAKLEIINNVYVWPFNEEAFTGAAHGSAGIAMTLLYFAKTFNCDVAQTTGIISLKSIFRKSIDENSETIFHDLSKKNSMAPIFGWCHGLEGYLWCLIYNREFIHHFTEEIDWSIAKLAGQNVISNPSICHGLAGRLELWNKISIIEKYSNLAENKILEMLNVLKITSIKLKGKITWFSDEAGKCSHDLWVGSLGVTAVVSNYINKKHESIL